MLCIKVWYKDGGCVDIWPNIESGKFEVAIPDPDKVVKIEADVAEIYMYNVTWDMRKLPCLPNLVKFCPERLSIIGLDRLMATSPKLKAVQAYICADGWFIYPSGRQEEDFFMIEHSDFCDMTSATNCKMTIVGRVKYIKLPDEENIVTSNDGTIEVVECNTHEEDCLYGELEINEFQESTDRVFKSHKHFEDTIGKSVWKYLEDV